MKRNLMLVILVLGSLAMCMIQGLFISQHTEAANILSLPIHSSSAMRKAEIALSKSLITPTSLQGDSDKPNIGKSLIGKYTQYIKNSLTIFSEPGQRNVSYHSSFVPFFQPITLRERETIYHRKTSAVLLHTHNIVGVEGANSELTPHLLKSLAKGVSFSLALTYGSYYLQEQLRLLAMNEKAAIIGDIAVKTYVFADYAYTMYGFWGTGGIAPVIELSSKALMRTVVRRGMKEAMGYGIKYAIKKGATFIAKEAITEFAPGVSSGGVTVVVGVSASLLQVALKYGIHLYDEYQENERIALMLQVLRNEEQAEETLRVIVEQRFRVLSYQQ